MWQRVHGEYVHGQASPACCPRESERELEGCEARRGAVGEGVRREARFVRAH